MDCGYKGFNKTVKTCDHVSVLGFTQSTDSLFKNNVYLRKIKNLFLRLVY